MTSRLLRAALTRLCAHLPRRDITGPDGSLYVSQYLLSPSAEKTAWRLRLRLHHFVRGDVDRELHSHPWYGVSLILAGGYSEEYRVRTNHTRWVAVYKVLTRVFRPGSINFITPNTFHRVDLVEEDAWTLFLSSPTRGSWGFWNRATGVYEDYADFFKRVGLGETNFGAKAAAQ